MLNAMRLIPGHRGNKVLLKLKHAVSHCLLMVEYTMLCVPTQMVGSGSVVL